MGEVRDNFGMLFNFSDLDAQTFRGHCNVLQDRITCGEDSDIDGSALGTEIESYRSSSS